MIVITSVTAAVSSLVFLTVLVSLRSFRRELQKLDQQNRSSGGRPTLDDYGLDDAYQYILDLDRYERRSDPAALQSVQSSPYLSASSNIRTAVSVSIAVPTRRPCRDPVEA